MLLNPNISKFLKKLKPKFSISARFNNTINSNNILKHNNNSNNQNNSKSIIKTLN